jgi:hypothetical protein
VKRSVFPACLCLGVFATGAFAADFSAKGSLSETVEGSDNYFLVNSPSGTTFKSLSAVNLSVLARTPMTQYLLDTHYSYYKYSGPGTADTVLTNGMPADATFRIDHTTELAKYNLATSWNRLDLASTLLTQTGVASAHGTQDTYKINAGVTRDLNRNDSITWSAQASTAQYIDSTLTPYKDVTTTLAWNRLLSPTTTLNNSVMFDWFGADDTANSQRLFWQIMTGLKSQLSKRLTLDASVGETFSNAYQSGMIAPPGTTFTQIIQPGAAHDWVANIGLQYQLLKNTKVSLTAAQTVMPTVLGDLQKSDTVGVTLSHDINHFSNLTFTSQIAHTLSLGTEANFFTASVAYAYKLTREWRTVVSYTYRQRNDDTGLARSSTVLLSLTRDFTLFGNPTAIDEADAARKKEREQKSIGEVFPTLP